MTLEKILKSPTFDYKGHTFHDAGELVFLQGKNIGDMAYYQFYGPMRKAKTREEAVDVILGKKK